MKLSCILIAAAILAGFAGTAQGTTFSLTGDWNASSDSASNLWAYGKLTTPGDPTTFSIPVGTNYDTTVVPGLGVWFLLNGIGDPNIEKNLTLAPIFSGGVDWLPSEVSFGPYNGPAVAQFTAPAAGQYALSASFVTDQIRANTGDGTTAYIYVGNGNVFTQTLPDPGQLQFGTPAFYTNTLTLTAGEKVDFVVGGGAFTTQVDATLTELPEPSTYAMMLGGLGLIGICMRRKAILG